MIAHIVLFDIDGTLISSSAAEETLSKCYLKTIRDVVGTEPSVIPSRFQAWWIRRFARYFWLRPA